MNGNPTTKRGAILECGGKRQRDTAFGMRGEGGGWREERRHSDCADNADNARVSHRPPSAPGNPKAVSRLRLPRALRGAAIPVVAFFTSLVGSVVAQDPHDPATELASFKIAAGFEVSLFASEKDGVIKPIAHRFDRLGRLWVIGSISYPQIKPGEEPNDYIRILEDTNGDGKADKVTTPADGLMIPPGIESDPEAQGCWVSEGTKLWHMRDKDGDGKADVKEVVLRGFGTGDKHQNINSFRWSPGGELFMSQGL